MRELVAKVIGEATFDGHDELRNQVPHLKVVGGPITFLELAVDRSAVKAAPIDSRRVPGQAWVSDAYGESLGTLIVWIDDGYISALEYAWLTDDSPYELPSVSQVQAE